MLGYHSGSWRSNSGNAILPKIFFSDGDGQWGFYCSDMGLRDGNSYAHTQGAHELGPGSELVARWLFDRHRKYGQFSSSLGFQHRQAAGISDERTHQMGQQSGVGAVPSSEHGCTTDCVCFQRCDGTHLERCNSTHRYRSERSYWIGLVRQMGRNGKHLHRFSRQDGQNLECGRWDAMPHTKVPCTLGQPPGTLDGLCFTDSIS